MTPDQIRQRRKQLGLTQAQLAERLGVAANTVARWERGERAMPPMIRLAMAELDRQAGDSEG